MVRSDSTNAQRNRLLYRRLAAAFLLLQMILMLAAQNDLLTEAVYFAMLPLLAGAAILFLTKPVESSRKVRLVSAAFTAVFFVMLPVSTLVGAPVFMAQKSVALNAAFLVSYLIAVALGAYICISAFLSACVYGVSAPKIKPLRLRCGIYPDIWPLAAFTLAMLLSTLPSMRIGDAPTMVHLAETGVWDEWHTAGYLIFVRVLYSIAKSDFPVILVQGLCWVLVNMRALSVLDAFGCPRRAGRVYVAVMLLSFVPTFYVNEMIKDVVFSTALLWFGLEALCFARAEKTEGKNWIALGLAGFFVSVFRLGGVLPVAVTIAALFFYKLGRRERARFAVYAALLSASGFILMSVYFRTRPDARRNPYYLTYSVPMQMIGALVNEGVELLPEDEETLTKIMPVERYAECFMHYHSDALSREYGAIGSDVKKISELRLGPELILVNWRLFTRYPVKYLTAFFDQSSLLWEMTTPEDGYTRKSLWYPGSYDSAEAPEGCRYTGFAALTNRYAEGLTAHPALAPLLWRGGFSTFMIALSGAGLCLKGRRRDLFLLLPVTSVTFFLFFSLPAQESRYIIPNLVFAALAAVYALYTGNESMGEMRK